MKNLYQFLYEQEFLIESKLDDLKKKWENRLDFIDNTNIVHNMAHEYAKMVGAGTGSRHHTKIVNEFIDNYKKDDFVQNHPEIKPIIQKGKHEIINHIYNIDPSPNKIYTDWMLKKYSTTKLSKRNFEIDYFPLNDNSPINLYHKNKHLLPIEQRDIHHFKTLRDLYNVTEKFMSRNVKRGQINSPMNLEKEAPLIYDSDNIKIYNPLTKEASCALGGSTWCTSKKDVDANRFDEYNRSNPLYIVHLKHEKSPYRKIAIHIGWEKFYDQFQDENNINIKDTGRLKEFIDRNPELLKTPLKDHIQSLLK